MRRTFSASSLDANLPLRFEGKVHSIFSKAFNVRTKENELISIVAAEKLNGPHRILLELPENEDFISFGIKKEARTVGTTQKISIDNGNFLISLRETKKWSPKIEIKEKISSYRIKDNLLFLSGAKKETTCLAHFLSKSEERDNLFGSFLSDSEERDNLFGSFLQKDFSTKQERNKKAPPITRGEPCFLTSFENNISQELRIRIQELTGSIKERNPSKISKKVKRLIGFGEGLTPSGDDFLVGLIASLHFLSSLKLKHLLNKIKRIINLEKEKTTFLSGKFLEYACQGRFPETILDLIEAIFSGNREEVREAARRCLDFGATSGRDTLLGILSGMSLGVRIEASET